jgi:hypothetical protein
MKSLINILERIKLTKEDISGMIRDAKKEKVTEPEELVQDTISSDPFSSAEAFNAYIRERYLSKGQTISGLDALYNEIILSNMSSDLEGLVTSDTNKSLKGGEYSIAGVEGELYDIIQRTIKIDNGHETELWFAIIFNGVVVGAEGKTPDVKVGNQTVSLKAYKTPTFDFGSLDAETSKHLNSFLNLAQLLTNLDVNKSKGQIDINKILDALETPEMILQIYDIFQLAKTADIPIIDKLAAKLDDSLNRDNPEKSLNNLVVKFCNEIDRLLEVKIKATNWWGLIVTGNKKLYLESADSVFEAVRCKNYRLSNAIAQFKGDHIWIKGTQLGSAVTTKKSKG